MRLVLLLWVERLHGIALILLLILVGLRLVVDVWLLLLIIKVGSPRILLRGNLLLRPSLLAPVSILLVSVLLVTSVKELATAVDCISGVTPDLTSVDLDRGPFTVSIHFEPTGHEGGDQEHSNDK